MVLMRVGDTMAAGLFEALDVKLKLGPKALPYVGCVLCGGWLVAARYLGAMYLTKATRTQAQLTALTPIR
jgi:hypothetical protein